MKTKLKELSEGKVRKKEVAEEKEWMNWVKVTFGWTEWRQRGLEIFKTKLKELSGCQGRNKKVVHSRRQKVDELRESIVRKRELKTNLLRTD